MSNDVPDKEWKNLWSLSLGCCAFPECKKQLVEKSSNGDPSANLAKIAHIKGRNQGSARFDPSFKDVNSEKNLLLLCGVHHDIIDKQPNKYSVDVLTKMKKDHEFWAENLLRNNATEITFAELKVIMDYLINCPECSNGSLELIPIKDKIRKNKLSEQTERLLKIGSIQIKQVQEYINACKDINFESRLVRGFNEEYLRLKQAGLDGDSLFNALRSFASKNSTDPKLVTSALTVLSYLFEKCEVFEK